LKPFLLRAIVMVFYTVYRTQNITNGRYYFGVHKTRNPYDGYLGSGKVLRTAVKKYGESSFIKNICFVFDNPEDAFSKEFELIESYREDPLCYNLRQGGSGGFDYINQAGLSPGFNYINANGLAADNRLNPKRIEAVRACLVAHPRSHPCSEETKLKLRKALEGRILGERTQETREKIRAANKGKVLSEETKEKIRQSRLNRGIIRHCAAIGALPSKN